jgi:tetratricopeptide (TPR) repeat protein
MKSERRHELEQYSLAQWLIQAVNRIKPYTNAILAGIAVVVLVALVVTWMSGSSEARTGRAWDQYFSALGEPASALSDLEEVAKNNPRTAAGTFALLTAADLQLDSGCNLLFTNKASANLELHHAVDNYLKVLEGRGSPAVLQRATFGLARAREALGEADKARESYQQLVKQWPGEVYALAGAKRLEDLDKQSTKEFYDRFAKFDPKPTPPQGPGTPGQRPEFNVDAIPDGPAKKSGESAPVKPGTLLDQQPKPDVTLPSLTPKAAPETPAAKPAEPKP